MNALKVHKSP